MDEQPAYKLHANGRLLAVRWSAPSAAAAKALAVDIEAHHAAVGKSLVFVILIGPECPIPDRSTREQLQRNHAQVYQLIEGARSLILPGSLRQRLMRRILVGMRMATALRGETFHHFGQLRELLTALEAEFGLEPATVARELGEAGLLTEAELEDSGYHPSP